MTVRVERSERSRHLLFRLSAGALVPDAIVEALQGERVSCGWLRASGVIHDVELRAFDPTLGGLASVRRIGGPIQLLVAEGSIGLVDGQISASLRAVLARESDTGLETLAGEIVSGRAVAVEVLVTVLEDLALERALDPAGVWLLGASAPAEPAPPQLARAPAASPAWSAALEASANAERDEPPFRRATAPTGAGSTLASPRKPQRPARPQADLDTPYPEAGDAVDHFAFGRCDVLKSDGDRLHLRVHKDGRIREIALEMLRVTRLDDEGGKRRFRLERRI